MTCASLSAFGLLLCTAGGPGFALRRRPVAGNARRSKATTTRGSTSSVVGGAFIDIRNPENYWGVRLEMHYAEKGSGAGAIEVGTTTIELRMNYIDIPILLDVNLGDYQVGFGPYLGRMIKAEKWQPSTPQQQDDQQPGVSADRHTPDPIGESAFFQARISGSALSLKKDGPVLGATPFGPRVRNVSLHFGIGWSIRGNG